MTSPNDIRGCSPAWLELFDYFENNREKEIKIECETPRRAYSMRLDFYRTRGLLLKDQGGRMLYPNVSALECKINEDPPYVLFRHKSTTPIGKMLSAALEKAKEKE